MNKKNVVIYVLILLLSVFVTSLIVDYDYDLFARLEVGEIFFKFHKLLLDDPFSYTPTVPWIDHEWGSGVIFYAFLKLLGPAGLILLNALLCFLIVFAILKKNKDTVYPLITASVFLFFMEYTAGSLIRCQMFTFVFSALTIYILESLKNKDTKAVWLIPVIVAFWCNMHGGVVSGLGIISVYCLIALIRREKFAKKILAVTFLSYLALLINPYGINYPAYLYSAVTVPRQIVEDWLSIFHPRFLYLYSWIILMIILLVSSKFIRDFKNKTFDVYHYVLIVITVTFGFAHVKGIVLAVITVFMLCSDDLNYYMNKLSIFPKIEKCLFAVIIVLALTIPFTIRTPRITFNEYPLTEVEFLKINNITGNILSDFEFGSYISYKLYPNNKIFVDGRYDGVYPMSVFDTHTRFMTGAEKWEDALKKYPTDILILPFRFPPVIIVESNPSLKFVEVFRGYRYSVYLKNNLIRNDYKIPTGNIEYYRSNIFKTDFIKYLKEEKND